MRISLAEQGHAARPTTTSLLRAPADPAHTPAMLVLEVADALAVHRQLVAEGAGDRLVAPLFSPPWGGHRFFLRDPDGYLVEIEQPA